MKLIGNIILLVLAGIWLFVAYVVAGILNCIFIITIPFGVQSFKLASRSFTSMPVELGSGRGLDELPRLLGSRRTASPDGSGAPNATREGSSCSVDPLGMIEVRSPVAALEGGDHEALCARGRAGRAWDHRQRWSR
jgi:hypothetical protein